MRERDIRAGDVHNRFVRRDRIAIAQGTDVEIRPCISRRQAQLQDGYCFVDASEPRGAFLKHLQGHVRVAARSHEHIARTHEVLVRVIPVPHPLDRQVEPFGRNTVGGTKRRRRLRHYRRW
jgi:hypothetical protein